MPAVHALFDPATVYHKGAGNLPPPSQVDFSLVRRCDKSGTVTANVSARDDPVEVDPGALVEIRRPFSLHHSAVAFYRLDAAGL